MSQTSLVALVRARWNEPFPAPDFVAAVLEASWPPCGDKTRGWSIGSVIGTETLVQSRPMIRSPNGRFVDDFLRTSAPCTIAAYVCDRRETGPPAPTVFRIGRWIGAGICAPEFDAEAVTTRLPGFLQRERRTSDPAEALFLRFVAELHRTGGLHAAYAGAEDLDRAFSALQEAVGDGHDLFVHDGRLLGLVNGRGRLSVFAAPPVPGRRRTAADAAERGPEAAVYTTCDGEFEQAAASGAERLSPGCFVVAPGRPASPQRVG